MIKEGAVFLEKYKLVELKVTKGYNQTWIVETEDDNFVMKFVRYQPYNADKVERVKKTVRKLNHKNISDIEEIFLHQQEGKKYFVIVSEFHDQGSLLRVVRHNKIDYFEKVKFMFYIAAGVEYLHSKNIVHRNLKPQNIYRWETIVKVGDFSVAKMVDGTHMTSDVSPYTHMSPEMFEGDQYGLQTDIWSLGIVFLQIMLAKQIDRLYEWSGNPCEEHEALLEQASRLPLALSRLVKSMLAYDKQDRVKIGEVVVKMAQYAEIDLQKYRTAPLQDFIRKKKKKDEINSEEDLIRLYNAGKPIFPQMPKEMEQLDIPDISEVDWDGYREKLQKHLQEEKEQRQRNPKPQPKPEDLARNRMGMGGMMEGMLGGMMERMMGGMGGMGMGGMGGMGRSMRDRGQNKLKAGFSIDPAELFKIPKKNKPSQGQKTTPIMVKKSKKQSEIFKVTDNQEEQEKKEKQKKEKKKKKQKASEQGKKRDENIVVQAEKEQKKKKKRSSAPDQQKDKEEPKKEKKKKQQTQANYEPLIKTQTGPKRQQKEAIKVNEGEKKLPGGAKPEKEGNGQVEKSKKEQKKYEQGLDKSGQALELPPAKEQQKPKKAKRVKEEKQFTSMTESQKSVQMGVNKEKVKKQKKKKSVQPEQSKEAPSEEGKIKVKKQKKAKKQKEETPQLKSSGKDEKNDSMVLQTFPATEIPQKPQQQSHHKFEQNHEKLQSKSDIREGQFENNLPSSYLPEQPQQPNEHKQNQEEVRVKPKRPKYKKRAQRRQEQEEGDSNLNIFGQATQKSRKVYEQQKRKLQILEAQQRKRNEQFLLYERTRPKTAQEIEKQQKSAKAMIEQMDEEDRKLKEEKRLKKLEMQKRNKARQERRDTGQEGVSSDEVDEEQKYKQTDYERRMRMGMNSQPAQNPLSRPQRSPSRHQPQRLNRINEVTQQDNYQYDPQELRHSSEQSERYARPPNATIDSIIQSIYLLETQEDGCRELGKMYYHLGTLYAETHLHKKAIEAYTKAIENCLAVEQSSELVAHLRKELGRSYTHIQSPERAIQNLELSLSILQSLQIAHPALQIQTMSLLGVAYKQLGSMEQAQQCYLMAIKVCQQTRSSPLLLLNPIVNIASLAFEVGKVEEAIKQYMTALKILKEAQKANDLIYATISSNLMEVFFATNSYHQGLKQINAIFRHYIDNRNTVQAEYFLFRERALKNIIVTMSKTKERKDFELIEGLLSQYFAEQERLVENLRGKLYNERGIIDDFEKVD